MGRHMYVGPVMRRVGEVSLGAAQVACGEAALGLLRGCLSRPPPSRVCALRLKDGKCPSARKLIDSLLVVCQGCLGPSSLLAISKVSLSQASPSFFLSRRFESW